MARIREPNRFETERQNIKTRYLAVLGAWVAFLCWTGMVKALAVLLPTLRVQFLAQTWLIGWMITIMDAFIDLSGNKLLKSMGDF